jgi:hypothetical protein
MATDINQIRQRLVDLGEEWADVSAAADLLEETRKSVRAQIALKYLPEAKTGNKAELMAEADSEYMTHIANMVDARRKANIAKVRYDASKTWCDMLRTQESTRRTEMGLR